MGGYTTATFNQTYSGIITYTHVFTPSLLNEARITAVRSDPDRSLPTTALSKVTPADLGINITPDIATGPPILFFDGTDLTVGFSPFGPTTFANTIYAYYDNLTWTKGRHNMKFGFYFSPYQNNTQYDYLGNGSFFFYGPSTAPDPAPIWPTFFLACRTTTFRAPTLSMTFERTKLRVTRKTTST